MENLYWWFNWGSNLFILSGFLITTLLLKEKVSKGKVSFKNFYIRRALRILPVAYLFLAVVYVLNQSFKLHITYKSFFTAFSYLKNFNIRGSDWYTGHFWTLSIEEQFYLFAPIILITNVNRYIKLIFTLAILVPIASYLVFNTIGVGYFINQFFYKISFVVLYLFSTVFNISTLYILSGSLLSILMFKQIVVFSNLENRYYLSSILFVIAICAHFPNTKYYLPFVSPIVFTLLICVVIVLNLQQQNFLTVFLTNKFLVKTGVLSYSLYIWQQLFTANQPWSGLFKYSDSPFFNMPILIVIANLSYHFYEKKFLMYKHKFA